MILPRLCRSFLVFTLLVTATLSQALITPTVARAETKEQRDQRMGWWRDARFGMFIHWGLYALPARHEWLRTRERIPVEQYQKYFEHFNPDLYNPRDWAKIARQAGMKYVVLTAKHHDSFCLFDSKFTDYKATNTPCGRDLFKEYVDAFRAEGLKVGFYYSLIDWRHPEYTVDRIHALRPLDKKDLTEENFAKLNNGRDMAEKAAYSQFLHEAAIGVIDDELFVAWYHNPKHELKGKTFQRFCTSKDSGRTWSDDALLMDRANDEGLMYVGMQFLTTGGKLCAFTNQEHGTERPVNCILLSWDKANRKWVEHGPIAERFLAMQQPI